MGRLEGKAAMVSGAAHGRGASHASFEESRSINDTIIYVDGGHLAT
jgi:hypothetical protein